MWNTSGYPTIEDIAEELQDTNDFRNERSEDFPDDLRNHRGAEICRSLIPEAHLLSETHLLASYQGAVDKLVSADKAHQFYEMANEYRRRIGFENFPEDIFAYIAELHSLTGEIYSPPSGPNILALKKRNMDLD